ncbi:MAG: 4Fe-4S dicluster domain-containing protein [Clostridia bacterium]|nr:4Fe-4S dicluster domain-containing protein [Clostridia bacterium]
MPLHGGIAPAFQKGQALFRPVVPLAVPRQVWLPLAYGTDAARSPACEIGDTVMRGRPISVPEQTGEPVLPCSVTGVLTDIRPLTHPLYGVLSCAVLDVTDAPVPAWDAPTQPDPPFTAAQIIEAARLAGIIDEHDGIPLFEKLKEAADSGCTVLAADAAAPEPFDCAAPALLTQHPEPCLTGLQAAARAVGAAETYISVYLPGRLRRQLKRRLGPKVLYQIPPVYPVRRFAPVRDDTAVCVVGLQACLALYRALYLCEPACTGVVTVTGDAVERPQNLLVPYGTPAGDLLAACGADAGKGLLIFGDAFTGVPGTPDLPVLPGMTCLLLMKEQPAAAGVCIGCGRCAHACHTGLLPYEIARRYENMQYARLPALQPDRCDGCGACAAVCPARRPLTAMVLQAAGSGDVVLEWRQSDD